MAVEKTVNVEFTRQFWGHLERMAVKEKGDATRILQKAVGLYEVVSSKGKDAVIHVEYPGGSKKTYYLNQLG